MATTARNYNDRDNPFDLAAPPPWFLADLAVFDPDLVIFPSRKRPEYVLGRKARRSGGITPMVQAGLAVHSDSVRMAELGLVPVSAIRVLPGHVQWSPRFFSELAARDTWRQGGAKRVADDLESREQSAQAKQRQDRRDELDARSGDAFRSYQYRTGQRISLVQHRPTAPTSDRAPLIVTP